MPHGWIILDKPHGLGSTQAVGAVKRVCREAGLGKVKVDEKNHTILGNNSESLDKANLPALVKLGL